MLLPMYWREENPVTRYWAIIACLLAGTRPALAKCAFADALYAPAGSAGDAARSGERYRLRHLAHPLGEDEDWREINQANYVLQIEEQVRHRSFYFGFAFPNGFARTQLTWLGASLAKSSWNAKAEGPRSGILYFDAGHKLVETDPDVARQAPAFLIMPDLAAGFWYRHGDADTFAPPDGLWRVAGCAR